MSANTEKMVARFLKGEQANKNISRYVLRHAGKGKQGLDVETFEITESLSLDELDNLANLIIGKAQLDADGLGPTLQRYTLTSYEANKEGGDKASSRQTFRLRGTADLDIDGDEEAGEEAPNNRGLMSQLMRHNEANNRTMVGSAGTMMNLMIRRLESQDRVVEKLLEERFRSLELIEEAMSKKHEREVEMFQVQAKEQRVTIGVQKIGMLIPVIMDKLSGGKMPAKNDPMVLMLEELVSSMDISQLQAIGSTLGPEQKIVFGSMLKRFQERKALGSGSSDNGVKKEN